MKVSQAVVAFSGKPRSCKARGVARCQIGGGGTLVVTESRTLTEPIHDCTASVSQSTHDSRLRFEKSQNNININIMNGCGAARV